MFCPLVKGIAVNVVLGNTWTSMSSDIYLDKITVLDDLLQRYPIVHMKTQCFMTDSATIILCVNCAADIGLVSQSGTRVFW